MTKTIKINGKTVEITTMRDGRIMADHGNRCGSGWTLSQALFNAGIITR